MRRLSSITTLQSFGIFLVVLGHSFTIQNTSGSRPILAEWLYYFIYSFHMPLFIFISGFLFIHTNAHRQIVYGRFILKKVKRLLLPYMIISTIAFVFKSRLSQYAMRPISPTFVDYVRGLIYPQHNPIIFFWFLPTIFILLSIAPGIRKLLAGNNVVLSLAVFVPLSALCVFEPVKSTFFCVRGAASCLVYFYMGCLASHYGRDKLCRLGNPCVVAGLFLALVLCTAVSIEFRHIFKLLPAIIGIAFSISLAYLIKNRDIFSSLHGYSYQIYLLSWFPQVFFQILYREGVIHYWVAACAMLLSGLFLPVMAARLVRERFGRARIAIGL